MSLAHFFLTVLVGSVCPSVWAKHCIKIDQCKCRFDDGSGTVDLSSLGFSNGTALAWDVYDVDGFRYSYNPCYPFTEGTCVNVAACQHDTRNGAYYNLGDASSVQFSWDGSRVIAAYWAPDRQRAIKVNLNCDRNAITTLAYAYGESSPGEYRFTVYSKDLCPTKAGSVTRTTPVTVVNPDMTDWGSWSSWSSWGACSVTCGTGSRMRTRTRACYKPGTLIRDPACSGHKEDDYRLCRVSDYCLPSYFGNLMMNCDKASFGCETGITRCIDIAQRCDGHADCEDDSDESQYFAGCKASVSSTGGLSASSIVTTIAFLILLLLDLELDLL